ncbi:hypothetical protein FQR65_LT10221 [Abscondita terminalis]|nr:hypothetical protein FQR65_LT10221 [Abscondita terminalis]
MSSNATKKRNKPKTVSNTINTILLSWNDLFESDSTYNLQIQNDFDDWKNVYWGTNTVFLVKNLSPCRSYNFRIQCLEQNWIYFKSATSLIPYFVMHMSRAVKFGDTSIIRKIATKKPILLETESKEGDTPLIRAIKNQNFQMVLFLINIGANVNTCIALNQRTPLMVALYHPNLQIAGLLIDKGANQKAIDCNQMNAFHYAIDSNIFKNVKFCLNYDFSINAVDNKGWTGLLRSVVLECSDQIIKYLLKNGADPLIKDKNGSDFYDHLKINNRYIYDKTEAKIEIITETEE